MTLPGLGQLPPLSSYNRLWIHGDFRLTILSTVRTSARVVGREKTTPSFVPNQHDLLYFRVRTIVYHKGRVIFKPGFGEPTYMGGLEVKNVLACLPEHRRFELPGDLWCVSFRVLGRWLLSHIVRADGSTCCWYSPTEILSPPSPPARTRSRGLLPLNPAAGCTCYTIVPTIPDTAPTQPTPPLECLRSVTQL